MNEKFYTNAKVEQLIKIFQVVRKEKALSLKILLIVKSFGLALFDLIASWQSFVKV